MPILPPTATLKSAVGAINALEERLAALEASHAALKAQMVMGDELRSRLGALEDFVVVTREGLRAVFTMFHPDPDHTDPVPPPDEEELPPVEEDPMAHDMAHYRRLLWNQHEVIMAWLERLGGRIPLG